MTENRFESDIRKKLFSVKVVRPWYRLPREAVADPFHNVEVFSARLARSLSNLV